MKLINYYILTKRKNMVLKDKEGLFNLIFENYYCRIQYKIEKKLIYFNIVRNVYEIPINILLLGK